MQFIKKVPIPAAGVMLGVAALGNLLQSCGEGIRAVCGVLAAFLLVLLLLKLFFFPAAVREDMQNPITAGVSATFPMALMLLSTYILPFAGGAARVLWWFAVALHALLIVWFTLKFVLHFDLKKVTTVFFILYVGIVVASVTAPAYGRSADVGTIAFWFGFAALLILLFVVTKRYQTLPVPEPAMPLICVYAAPTSLCVAGYVQSVMPKSFAMLIFLLVLALSTYVFALIRSFSMLKLPFYPSYAAFTFPFVIAAIAFKQGAACAAKLGHALPLLSYAASAATLVAVVLVVYTYLCFMKFIFSK